MLYFIAKSSVKAILEIKYGNTESLLLQNDIGLWDCITTKITCKDVERNLVVGFVFGATADVKIGVAGGIIAMLRLRTDRNLEYYFKYTRNNHF